MKLAFKFLMYYLAILPIAFAQSEAAEAVQNETVKLPECEKSPFEIKFLPDTKILYLRVTQECEGLIKELGSELRKPEYSSDEVVGYVFDLQGSKLSNQTPSIYGLTSIFVNLDSFLTEKVYGGKKKSEQRANIFSRTRLAPFL